MKVRIKEGAIYGQDFGFHVADKELSEIIFDAEYFNNENTKLRMIAPGYGKLPGEYGCGAIYTLENNVIPASTLESDLREENEKLRSENKRLNLLLYSACTDKGRECFCGFHKAGLDNS